MDTLYQTSLQQLEMAIIMVDLVLTVKAVGFSFYSFYFWPAVGIIMDGAEMATAEAEQHLLRMMFREASTRPQLPQVLMVLLPIYATVSQMCNRLFATVLQVSALMI
jgi:hypothetical protein